MNNLQHQHIDPALITRPKLRRCTEVPKPTYSKSDAIVLRCIYVFCTSILAVTAAHAIYVLITRL